MVKVIRATTLVMEVKATTLVMEVRATSLVMEVRATTLVMEVRATTLVMEVMEVKDTTRDMSIAVQISTGNHQMKVKTCLAKVRKWYL